MHSMFTICPKCTLTLAVTAEDLRAGQGYVRCGRCLNVFNALLALSEEADSDSVSSYSQADPASSSQITRALASANQPAEPPPLTLSDSQRTRLATEISSDGAIENESSLADGTGSFETIVLEGEGITQTEEFAPQESVDNEIAQLAERLGALPGEKSSANDDEAERDHAEPGGPADEADADEADAAHAIEVSELAPAQQPHYRRWLIGSTLLVLLFVLQIINHWRDAIASRPSFSEPMTRLYSHLGVMLDPHWDLAAYDIRQQGAASDPSDSHLIRVRLSLANRAARSQPVPLLRLTLLDRYGKRIAARDLTPAEYWPHGQPARSFLAHDERVDSEIAVRDPGADSASFEIDVCLPNVHGTVRCAGDLPAATSGAS
jgi:predicted Zn finger-like uncharacterized protein